MPNINLPLPAELLARIDSAAGEVPRVRWIRTAIEQRLADGKPSILDAPMVPVAAPDPTPKPSIAPTRSAADIVKSRMR